jgi:hypothetical protein
MKKHLNILGVCHILFGVLGAAVTLGFLNKFTGYWTMPEKVEFLFSTSGWGSVLVFLFALASLPAIVGGIGLLFGKPWARFVVLVLSFVNLMNIPLGSMLGIYAIWVVMNTEPVAPLEKLGSQEPFERVFPPYRTRH